ncbi:MAG: hydrogenase formation protein HypD [Candidatus Caldatribacteriota bacterium]|nr:hydrogenase formation protein HypD [Atribacterota bacterium]MDD3031491.1 hydrogenase formation protein HypD [Atribacterota bacterium]MDD3640845.1 hydrogenase formation protein HypD [Atribacterota bacterium]MDD4288360.1 hydrogenase formation protein HypD [Atribacterota bacterium]MDD4764681.1 hydrogenase formation protein HypD [Atribacterota bacterium]
MKYRDEYRNKDLCQSIIKRITELTKEKVNIMEVCGTHTVSIFRSGLKELLPENINLISGPGCPVCVTPIAAIDHIIALAREKDTIIVTFGDMVNVPGTSSSLKKEKANGADILIIYSPFQVIEIARKYPEKKVILIGIGFETTTPLLASVILEVAERQIDNFYLFSLAKIMPPIMQTLLQKKDAVIDGFLCPGHVSAIIGTKPYEFIPDNYHIPCVIAGFEPGDILIGIYHIIQQNINKKSFVENKYQRVVKKEGNPVALRKMAEVFNEVDSTWRGIGNVKKSGLDLKEKYASMNARNLKVKIEKSREHPDCRCGEVLRGIITPLQCPLFRKICTPENPIGACMVSSEGSCAAYYKYNSV